MAKLSGKVALVTGAGQGVGQGIALALAEAGASLALAGKTLSKVQSTQRIIEGRGGAAFAVQCDVKSDGSLRSCVSQVVERFGTINILVNNAQEVFLGSLFSVSDDQLSAGWESGPLASFRLMKLCHQYLKGGGCIINLGSSSAMRWDAANYGAYASVKEAIRSLSRSAACEWAKDGIRTNVILPLARSPALEEWIRVAPAEAAAFISTVPQNRVGDCEKDIGRFVVSLCSDESSYINGQTIGVDGGQAYLG